jgi:hypothetical protein
MHVQVLSNIYIQALKWPFLLLVEDSSKVSDLDIVFVDKSVLVYVSDTDPLIPSIRHDVAGPRSRFGHPRSVRARGSSRVPWRLSYDQTLPRRRQAHQVWGDGGEPGLGVFPDCCGNFRWLGEECPQAVGQLGRRFVSSSASTSSTMSLVWW